MTSIEASTAGNEAGPGRLEDLYNLQVELAQLSEQGVNDLHDLVITLDDTEFTRRVYESFYAGGSYTYLASGHQTLGELTVAKIDSWGEHGAYNDRLEFFGQKRNGGLLDYTYTIKIRTMHVGGIYDNEILVDKFRNPIVARYSKGKENVVDCIENEQFDTAAELIQIALADLIAGLENHEHGRQKLKTLEEQLLKGVARTIHNFVRPSYSI
jgi:hypothetical protein